MLLRSSICIGADYFMTNSEILKIAMRQSAIDSGADISDFKSFSPKVVLSKPNPAARKYLELPFSLNLISYGNNTVASVSPELYAVAEDYINKYPAEHCFETPNLHYLIERIKPYGLNICFMAEYFLPDVDILKPLECGYTLRLLFPDDFKELYLPQWSNALCEKRKPLDVLGVGAYDGDTLIGLAGASADCETMWQIGIDVLPAYRRQGVASALTSHLASEILKRGKVPFYCCAWSNIKSARNAIKSGFRPAWAEVTARPEKFIYDML